MRFSSAALIGLATAASARNVPSNVKSFYDAHLNQKCPNTLSIAYKSGSSKDTVYCKDNTTGAIYLKGTTNGKYADMDIDCDGANASQGRCNNDPSGQSMTAFQDDVKQFGISDLDAHIHTYVVLGNDNSAQEGNGGKKFDPKKDAGVEPLSVVAVVCGSKMFYAVWGDVNGGNQVGEASLSVGQLCYGDNAVSGDNGHGERDVLYIAFPGEDAKVGKNANWKAKSKEEFEQSLGTVGDKLVAKLGNGAQSRIMRATL